MEEYLRVKAGPLGRRLESSRLFGTFAMATPGMRELLSIGKVWELAQLERRTRDAAPYDLVIVDAPATGHGVGFLHTPRTFAEIARVGPIARQAGKIAATIADREFTGVVAVALPEEMAVAETISLSAALAQEGLTLDLVVLNARLPRPVRRRRDRRAVRSARVGTLGVGPLGARRRRFRARPRTRPASPARRASGNSSRPRPHAPAICSPSRSARPSSSGWPTPA